MKKGLFVLASLLIVSSSYAVIDFGNFVGINVEYQTVQTSDDGYFGTPHVTGDKLIFDPAGFGVQASGLNGIDFKDGTMLTYIQAKPGRDIDSVEIEEFGDYSLIGNLGGLGTLAQVSGTGYLRVEEVEGVALLNPITFTGNMIYTPSGGDYNIQDDGTGLGVLWEGELKFNIDALLAGEGIVGKATRVHFTMDNTLVATSENGTTSFIKKKEIGAFTMTVPVPEPATMVLLGLGSLIGLKRRK